MIHTQAFTPHYYMALGDSLSFGFQPNFDFSSGFADVIFNDLRKSNVTGIVNYAWTIDKGIQLGVVNIVRDNPKGLRVLPVFNTKF